MKRYFLSLLFLALNAVSVNSSEPFVVSDIRVEGLQRISAGSIFSALPINVGDQIDSLLIRNAIRTLFRTGNFDNIYIARDNTVLVVSVQERPSISEINIDGNKVIETEALLEGLKGSGLSEGKVFKRATLEGMKMELTRQYVSQGRYDARIETDISSLPRNRVAVNIDIDEGTTAAIKHINIIGNSVFDDDTLTDLFELKSTGWFSWISGNDKYAKEKLSGDLDTLESHYLDRGYINFTIESTQVSVTPDREAVYITANISEGNKYQVGEVKLSGDLVIPEEQLRAFIFIAKGQTFSQSLVTSSEEWLTKRLGNDGYNFAKVKGIPEIIDENHTVNLKFFIDPGKRTYVRRIDFQGNTRTSDEVLRREMRQMEGAPASSSAIEQSRIRLERLGYFKQAEVDILEVPGSDDLIDLDYAVEEQSSGSIGASMGYSQDSGVLLGANIQKDNFLGTGKKIGIGLNKSNYLTNLNFSYVDPYYTKDGVSRGFSAYYSERDLKEINLSNYSTNTLGARLNFSYPIKETERLGFSFGYSKTEITAGFGAVQEIKSSPRLLEVIDNHYTQYYVPKHLGDGIYSEAEVPFVLNEDSSSLLTLPSDLGYGPGFLDENGDEFDNFTTTISWNQSTLNRGRMATRGASQSLSFELTVPGSDLEFFKLIYNGQIFFPLSQSFTLRLRSKLGYGDGLNGGALPFFNHFYSGGFGSVRGFKSNTLGPLSTPAVVYRTARAAIDIVEPGEDGCSGTNPGDPCGDGRVVGQVEEVDEWLSYVTDTAGNKIALGINPNEGRPFGGNILIEGGAELLFPLPFIKDQRSVRTAFFIDAGNVFSTNCGDSQDNCSKATVDELRFSYGVGLSWITGFGPLTFSYAKVVNESEFDETENFQFSLGRSF